MSVASTARPRIPAIWSQLRPLTGERLAVGAAALAVAMLPLLRPSGPGNSSPVDAFIAISLGLTVFWAGSAGLKLRFPYALGMGIMIGAGALAALASPIPLGDTSVGRPAAIKRALGVLALLQDGVVLLWCANLTNVLRSADALRVVLRTLAYAAAGWALLLAGGSFAHLTALTRPDPEGTRLALTFSDPNMGGSYFFVGMMMIWATGTPRHLLLRVGAYLVLAYAILLTASNGAIVAAAIGFVFAIGLMVLRRIPRMTAIALVCFLVLGVGALFTQVHISAIQNWADQSGNPLLRNSLGRSSTSAAARQLLLEEGVDLYFSRGLLGWGPNAAPEALEARHAVFVIELHNDFAATLIERGVLGEVGLLVLIAGTVVRVGSVVGGSLTPDVAAVVPRTAPLAGAALGVAVSANFYQVLHFRHVWALLAVIAALHLWGRKSPA
jgi:hypothetical protein